MKFNTKLFAKKLLPLTLACFFIAGCTSNNSDKENITDNSTEVTEDNESDKADEVTEDKQISKKQRTVITTDGEVDDMNSVIRALLYSNDMDISGIVITSSMYHYAGDEEKSIEPFRWTGTDWIYDFIDAYGEVYENLKVHDSSYPTPEYLKSITKIGNISNQGEMDEVTEGSKFLEELFLDDDERTLYVQTWGGTNTTARALKSIEEKYKDTEEWEDIQNKINNKLVLYIILDQDDSYNEYIAKNWPNIKIINDRSNFWHFAYAWQFHNDELNSTLKGDWCYENLVNNKGALMDKYFLMGDGKTIEGELYEELRGTQEYLDNNPNYSKYDFISEGDSPSFLYLIDMGLRSLEDPSYGGWGGRFSKESDSLYLNNALDYNIYSNTYEAQYTLSRWFDDIQNDFAARVDWCLASNFEDANHTPTVTIEEGIDLTAKAGDVVTLTANGSDVDGDNLTYKWWRYFEADTYQDSTIDTEAKVEELDGLQIDVKRELGKDEKTDTILINNAESNQMSFTVPEDAKSGDTIHMVVEVQDDGNHTLKIYQRVIITVQ